jgi:hypothetical protein
MMRHLHNGTTLPMETHVDLVMQNNVALCRNKQANVFNPLPHFNQHLLIAKSLNAGKKIVFECTNKKSVIFSN